MIDTKAEDVRGWAQRKLDKGARKAALAQAKAATPQDEPADEGEPDFADEMATWLSELTEDHPQTADWIRRLGDAIEAGEPEAIEAAWSEAPTGENPEYPKLSPEERGEAGEYIREHMGHMDRHPGGREQAIAIGLRQAAPGKYEDFEKKRKAARSGEDEPDEDDEGGGGDDEGAQGTEA